MLQLDVWEIKYDGKASRKIEKTFIYSYICYKNISTTVLNCRINPYKK